MSPVPRRAKLLTLCVLAFVAVDAAHSMCLSPRKNQAMVTHACARTVLGVEKQQFPIKAEAIHFACTKVTGIKITHYEGSFSRVTDQITCSEDPVYSYVIGQRVRRSAKKAVSKCFFRACAFVELNKDTLYISGVETKKAKNILYLVTTIDPKRAKELDLNSIARTVAKTYTNSITEEGELRRRALLGSIGGSCLFPRDAE